MRVEHLSPKLRAEALNEAIRQGLTKCASKAKTLDGLFIFSDSDKEDFWWAISEGEGLESDSGTLDLNYDQHLMSIRPSGSEAIGHIHTHRGLLKTDGQIGEQYYPNFIELIKGLQGKGITLDMFYF